MAALDSIEHVEIGLRGAQDQILSGLDKIGFGLRNLEFRLVVGHPVLPAEQRLTQGQRVAVAVEVRRGSSAAAAKVQFILVPEGIGGQRQRWQQAGARLRHPFASGFEGRAGCRVCRVVGLRHAINLHQIGGPQRRSQQEGGKQPDESFHNVLNNGAGLGQLRQSRR
jgi:hypothetical protein